MPEITRLSDGSDWIELDFVERQRTPEFAMRLDIQMHVAGLYLSNTISILERSGVECSRTAVHDWVQKADLQPEGGASPNHVALDETVIRINDQQYWLYAAVDPETNKFLHIRLFSTYTTGLTEIFLSELCEKHDVETAVFLVDDDQWVQTPLDRHGLDCRYERYGNRNTVERIFREVKR
jgi:transposase-like protein